MNHIERVSARATDLGDGMQVLRALPTRQRRMIGAWCFLDHAGPVSFAPGAGMHVGAHPHTCLQTFTWLIEGEILHRDSLGNEQVIRPGQVNLMTAGRGIVHTEDSVAGSQQLNLAQLWIALPPEMAFCEPRFEHYPVLPRWDDQACSFTLLAGSYAGRTAPAQVHSPLVGIDLASSDGANLSLALDPSFEYGILPLEGDVTAEGEAIAMHELAYSASGATTLQIQLAAGSRALLLGGLPFAEPVVMWWNFVGSSKAVVAQAQQDWENGTSRFPAVSHPGERRLVAPALPWSDAHNEKNL